MTTKFDDFRKNYTPEKVKKLIKANTIFTDTLDYLRKNNLRAGFLVEEFKKDTKNFQQLTGKQANFARSLDVVLPALSQGQMENLPQEKKEMFEKSLHNFYTAKQNKPIIELDKYLQKFDQSVVDATEGTTSQRMRGGKVVEVKADGSFVEEEAEVNKLEADEEMLEVDKERDAKRDDKDLDIDLDEVERRKYLAEQKEMEDITVMDADEDGNPMQPPPDTATEAQPQAPPVPPKPQAPPVPPIPQAPQAQAQPAPQAPAPAPAPEPMQDPALRSISKSTPEPTLAELIPKERLTTDFKNVATLMKDINYFFETFPEPLKQIKNEFDKLTPRKKANLMVLQRIHGRIVGTLQPEGSKEATGKIGIVVDAEQYIEMKIREMIVSNRFANLTPAEVINVNEGVDTDKKKKAKDYGKFEIQPAKMGGKLFMQREPVYKAIPSNKNNEEEKPAYAMRQSQPKRFGVNVAKQINLAKTAISFNNRNPFSQPLDTIKLRVLK